MLWVRSQDGKEILKINDNIRIIRSSAVLGSTFVESPIYKITVDWYNVATYSTEEKAMKVMDMIQNKILEFVHYEGYAVCGGKHYRQPQNFVAPKVFQMPKDEEV